MGGKRVLGLSGEELWRLYRTELLTMQAIADRFGCTKQAIQHRLKRLGVDYHVTKLVRKCKKCGGEFTANRAGIKGGTRTYCSSFCYHADRSIYGTYSKAGSRVARAVVGAKEGEVVHHINGDHLDSRPENLMVFPSNAAHVSFHKSGAAKMLKEKVETGQISIRTSKRGVTLEVVHAQGQG